MGLAAGQEDGLAGDLLEKATERARSLTKRWAWPILARNISSPKNFASGHPVYHRRDGEGDSLAMAAPAGTRS
jgi:hypothetical protein